MSTGKSVGSERLDHLVLGKTTQYVQTYDASLLQEVPREISRKAISLPQVLPFEGVDIWNAYEVSWLNAIGKPIVAIIECRVPIDSPNLIESKSFKLYLNSFNQTRFNSTDEVLATMQQDLSKCAGGKVNLNYIPVQHFSSQLIGEIPGYPNQSSSEASNKDSVSKDELKQYPVTLLDDLDVNFENYNIKPEALTSENTEVSETLVSHLLKSNCLITNQPDWGSILVRYSGKKINHEALLKYIVSFRQHNEFHEQCVERIFYDIYSHCKPKELSVYARYTRRGGLDINPFRSNFEKPYANIRLARQ